MDGTTGMRPRWTLDQIVAQSLVVPLDMVMRHELGECPAEVAFTERDPSPNEVDEVFGGNRLLICDRDRKWSAAVEGFLASAGVKVIRTPFLAPNCNAVDQGRMPQSRTT